MGKKFSGPDYISEGLKLIERYHDLERYWKRNYGIDPLAGCRFEQVQIDPRSPITSNTAIGLGLGLTGCKPAGPGVGKVIDPHAWNGIPEGAK